MARKTLKEVEKERLEEEAKIKALSQSTSEETETEKPEHYAINIAVPYRPVLVSEFLKATE